MYPWVIDTSVIYHHTRGPPYKASLKWLVQKWLSKEIQKPSKTADGLQIVGHNSEEDARAAVELVKLKMAKGPTFGEFATDMESIFERLGMADPKKRTAIVDHGNPAQWHGAKADTAVACKTDDEVRTIRSLSLGDTDTVIPRSSWASGTMSSITNSSLQDCWTPRMLWNASAARWPQT